MIIIDEDADGQILQRFEIAYAAGEASAVEVLRARVVADVQRLDRDHPEQHMVLVQALRSRERDGEIELFTAPMVDVEAQASAAAHALESGDLMLEVDGQPLYAAGARVNVGAASVARFCRLGLLLGG